MNPIALPTVNPARGFDESFTYGRREWNVHALWASVIHGEISAVNELLKIEPWARRMLLPCGLPRKFYREQWIDPRHIERLSRTRLEVPGLAVRVGSRLLVVDGNHRLVARWLNGHNTMTVWVIADRDARCVL